MYVTGVLRCNSISGGSSSCPGLLGEFYRSWWPVETISPHISIIGDRYSANPFICCSMFLNCTSARCLVAQSSGIVSGGTKWGSILPYMCLVLEEYMVFPATVNAPVLSQWMGKERALLKRSPLWKLDRYTTSFDSPLRAVLIGAIHCPNFHVLFRANC